MNEKDYEEYVNKIQKLSDKKIVEEYKFILNQVNLKRMAIGGAAKSSASELAHTFIKVYNEYQNKLNHLIFEIVNKRGIKGLDDVINEGQKF